MRYTLHASGHAVRHSCGKGTGPILGGDRAGANGLSSLDQNTFGRGHPEFSAARHTAHLGGRPIAEQHVVLPIQSNGLTKKVNSLAVGAGGEGGVPLGLRMARTQITCPKHTAIAGQQGVRHCKDN